ncbi:MAG TPA: phosphomannomutase [Acidimicrobiaceae bacterium]|nr:phosphomannomutase [Acidimicrobiaceae bacterium]
MTPAAEAHRVAEARAAAERWMAAEPDADMRDELVALLGGSPDELVERFTGRLQFGTAGLRAAVGAGPQRMNRLVVQQAAAGLVDYLLVHVPHAAEKGVIIGYDARRKSDSFALDTARVCAARGVKAMLFEFVVPTPVLAWNITATGAAAGVMVTASHNPPADNGYKVYLHTGSQIVPPADTLISSHIDSIDPCTVALAPADHPLIQRLGRAEVEAYLADVPSVRRCPEVTGVPVAYTAMHGVGGATLMEAFDAAGLPAPAVVAEQQEPNGSFPTVSFPNPEEPGAMDLLMARAAASGALLAIANDPDADRLGVAIPTPDGGWRRLGGDEIGWLLADHILRHPLPGEGSNRLVVTTLVSSSLLGRMAAAHGATCLETFTGFKWIGHTVLEHPELHFVFGYEQALGYLVAQRPLDKDGITAAVLMAEVAAVAAAEGLTLQDRLDAIAAEFGRHVMAEKSVRMPPADGAAAVARLRANPPTHVGAHEVTAVQWFDEAGLLRLSLGDDVRLQVRPSGTEPKVKLYGEGIGADPASLLDDLAALLA